MEAWHEPYASQRAGPDRSPRHRCRGVLRPAFRGVPVHVLTTDEVRAMAARYGDVAAWAREAGYDGVQLGSANAKLLDQFLSPFYNRRTDEFGGSLENRARVLRLIREPRSPSAPAPTIPCMVKVPAETAPPGFPAHDARRRARAWRAGRGVGLRRGHARRGVGVPRHDAVAWRRARLVLDEHGHGRAAAAGGAVAAPARASSRPAHGGAGAGRRSRRCGTATLFTAVKRAVVDPGARGRRHPHRGRGRATSSTRGEADLVGIGRPFYAEPDLAAPHPRRRPGARAGAATPTAASPRRCSA